MFNLFSKRELKKKAVSEGKKINRSHIPLRLNILFLIVFILFILLLVKLSTMQILNESFYVSKLNESSKTIVKTASARGMIYDAKGRVVVSNIGSPSITYTRGQNISSEDMRETALKLVSLIKIDPSNLTERDRIDFFLASRKNYLKVYDRLSEFDKKDNLGNAKPESEIYAAAVKNVTKAEMNQYGENGKRAAFVYKKMNGAAQFNTVAISTQELSKEEIAKVGENEADLSGIGTGTSWERKYSNTGEIRPLLGKVSTEQQGLPEEKLDDYLKKGYERNDRVGTSYLEEQYEEYLHGKPSQSEVVMNNQGEIVKQEVIKQGSQGDNVKMTIDLEFQKGVDKIMKKYFDQALKQGRAQYSEGAFAVVMNPNTGGVLAMSGILRDVTTGEINPYILGTFQAQTEPGSVVKGATITAGYETGVIKGNDTILDTPIKLQGTPQKASVFNPTGANNMYLTAKQALEYSSNDYMMKLVIKMLGQEYFPNMVLNYDKREEVYKALRQAYAQYGLGVKTGLDLPQESSGQVNKDMNTESIMGKLLDLSFGQYDTYTALQLADYVSTVANGGKRYIPHVVEGIYGNNESGGLGKLVKKIEPKVGNTIPISKNQMSIIQDGFYDVVHGTGAFTTGTPMQNADISISAKTGTAEVNAYGKDLVNSNVVAYAPSDKPKVALSVVFPHLKDYKGMQNMNATKEIVNLYNKMYLKK
ncbi:MAG: penicillin-binding protein 2 [Streptococcaceae bacterium]|nr:penicillin-binding protein 2 [Streptococcaceae bacterium]